MNSHRIWIVIVGALVLASCNEIEGFMEGFNEGFKSEFNKGFMDSYRESFVESCVEAAMKDDLLDRESTVAYCECFADGVQKKYPDPVELTKQSSKLNDPPGRAAKLAQEFGCKQPHLK